MTQPTQTPERVAGKYRPCGHCRRCTSGVPLGEIPSPDDCYSRFLDRSTAALGIVEPEAAR